ncbi:MAG: transglycosylase SLT domain-containing protein [Acidobacteria bacterium]|nr:transglycosylase SLT domain-containing protein [Acidobacteriota bacterium]
MGRYEDYIAAELAARDLPPSLRYLPLIEADYYHLAVSPAGAAGLWQLMPETARWLGLEVNSLVDQRFDVYAATEAALDYLVALHDRFECWFLALAAYNAGPTRIERAIRRHGGARPRNDALFGHIRDLLPNETRDFIPKFLASVRLAGDISAIGQAAPEKDPPERFDVVRVAGAASADVLAEAAGISEDEIRTLNPHLRIGLAPAGRSTRLRVPVGAGETFLARFARIPAGERSTLREHTVVPGETLVRIAGRYGVPLNALRTVNPDVEPRRMRIGTVLVVPRAAGTLASGSRIAANPTPFAGIRPR